ncbi:MAG TPA: hypothetical protein V6C78_10175 [Crinalium sp.]|jgi:hypothetical protein
MNGFKDRLLVSFITLRHLQWVGLLALFIAAGTIPVLAQSANFDPLTLSPGFAPATGTVQGYTGGSFSLSAIANRDRAGNLCLGYADSTPDHIMTLQQNFPQLTLQVDSGGNDTTLVIEGPNNVVRCADDTDRTNKDASITDSNWPSGTYRIWVGAIASGARYDYTLQAQ